jgi:hypothetical protein
MIYATGFVLEKLAAMQEHGLRGSLLKMSTGIALITAVSLYTRNMGM